jgi:hypothetical protein
LEGRNLVLAPTSETALLKNELFIAAQQRGDFGSALESATLGRILGFDTYMDQNVNSMTGGDVATGSVTAAHSAGETLTAAACVVVGYPVNNGEFCVVDGNDQPQYITANTTANGGADTATVTLNEANKYATSAGATATVFKAVRAAAGYSAGDVEAVVVGKAGAVNAAAFDASQVRPAVGQLLACGTPRTTYTIIESYPCLVDGTPSSSGTYQAVYLDRPLDANISTNDLMFPGPAGALNMAFHRNAIALVTRPLAIPNNAMGVLSHVGVYNDIAMRVSMQYSIAEGGTVVCLDILAGVAVLDTNLCVVLQG